MDGEPATHRNLLFTIHYSELPGALPGGAILGEVFVEVLIRDRKMVLEWNSVGFSEKFLLELLIAECRAILVREVPFLKGPVRDGQREFPVFRFQGHHPVAVIPAARL
jgi:hypothetical protein